MDYLEFLDRLHTALRPRAYLETGVEFGASLRLSRTHSIAVAANARLSPEAIFDQPWLKLYRETSDAFFREHSATATLEGRPLDLAVIDGIHAFSQVVREIVSSMWRGPGQGKEARKRRRRVEFRCDCQIRLDRGQHRCWG